MRKINSTIYASFWIFVINTITIIIYAFGIQFIDSLFAFGRICFTHKTGISFFRNPQTQWICNTHLCNKSILVQIIRTIFIHLIVHIIVMWTSISRIVPQWILKIMIQSIGIQDWHKIPGKAFQILIFYQFFSKSKSRFSGNRYISFGIGHNKNSWLKFLLLVSFSTKLVNTKLFSTKSLCKLMHLNFRRISLC